MKKQPLIPSKEFDELSHPEKLQVLTDLIEELNKSALTKPKPPIKDHPPEKH